MRPFPLFIRFRSYTVRFVVEHFACVSSVGRVGDYSYSPTVGFCVETGNELPYYEPVNVNCVSPKVMDCNLMIQLHTSSIRAVSPFFTVSVSATLRAFSSSALFRNVGQQMNLVDVH